MFNGTLICVADGSHKTNGPYTDVCSAGWIVHDTMIGRFIKGSFVERSERLVVSGASNWDSLPYTCSYLQWKSSMLA